VLANREHFRAKRGVASTTMFVQTQQADVQKKKWVDPYKEFDKQMDHPGNLKL
jgi:hypothetical protein